MTVSARLDWQFSGIRVKAGDVIVIEVLSGQWSQWKGISVDYRGCTGSTCVTFVEAGNLTKDASYASLIALVGGRTFGVRSQVRMTAAEEGSLWFRINDRDVSDNDGELRIRIAVY